MLVHRFRKIFLNRCNKKLNLSLIKYCHHHTRTPPWSVVFFGADGFSVPSLSRLNEEFKTRSIINSLEVVTTIKSQKNPVLKFAVDNNIKVHQWPMKFKIGLKTDLGIVVSFGHLIPEDIINHFHFGILNVHASLLPRWRGAAPIIHAIANGDTTTGITVMRIRPEKFDIGDIVVQKEIELTQDMKQSEVYVKLSELGANALIECIRNLNDSLLKAKPQQEEGVTYAPKVTPEIALINWKKMSAEKVYNLGRALDTLFPLRTTWKNITIKLFDVILLPNNKRDINQRIEPGAFIFSKENDCLCVQCLNGYWVGFKKVSVPGKKLMSARDFNNGYLKKTETCNNVFKS